MMAFINFLLLMIPVVIIHELGHYGIGRLFGIQAQVFSVGFGPKIFSRKDKNGTLWQVALLPLGGYVKFAPDNNGTNFPNLDPEKPAYQASFLGRMLTILAGPVSNFLFSFLLLAIFAGLHGPQGESLKISQLRFDNYADIQGLTIAEIDGQVIESLSDFYEVTAPLGDEVDMLLRSPSGEGRYILPNPNLAYVEAVIPGEPAQKAGVQAGDRIIQYGETASSRPNALAEAIQNGGGKPETLTIIRDGETREFLITPVQKSDGSYRIGIYFGSNYQFASEPLGLGASLRFALNGTNWVLSASFDGLKQLFQGDVGLEALSGPVGIARIADEAASQGFWDFVVLMATISSAIGFMNLLPIPILDGGHLILQSYEKIFGRLPPAFVLNLLFMLGIAILLGVLLITTSFELLR